MAIYKEDIVAVELQSGTIQRSFLNHSIGSGDKMANRFGVSLFRNGAPVSAESSVVTGVFMAPDGNNYGINETSWPGSTGKEGNKAWVQLPEICYAVTGQFCLAIKLSGGGVEGTMRIIDGTVSETGEAGAVVPTSTIPTTAEIIAAYEEAVEVIGGSVRFDASQTLSDAEAETARQNIEAAGIAQVVRIDETQNLTDTQKSTARANIGTVRADDIAPAFSTSTTYSIGQYVTYNGVLYRFVANHSEGSWNATQVSAVDIGKELCDLNAVTGEFIISEENLEQGQFTGSGGKDANNTRIRLISPIRVPKGTVFDFSVGSLYWLVWELKTSDTTGGNVITATGWNQNASYTTQNDCWVMMSFANGATVETSTAITPATFDNYSVVIKRVGNGIIDELSDLTPFVNVKDSINQVLITFSQLERGQFTSSYGKQDSSIRIRLINPIRVPKGTVFDFSVGSLYWLIWELSSSRTTGGNVITSTGWNQNTSYTVQNDCWVMMSFANGATVEASTAITPDDFRPYFAAIDRIGEGITEEVATLKQHSGLKKLPELYISEFVQAALTASGFTESTQRLSTLECVALPYGEHTVLHVEMNGEYLLGIRCGRTAQNLSSNKWWYQNGDVITFEDGEQYYRLSIAHRETSSTYSDITLAELPTIGLHITYESDEIIADVEDGVETFINAANGLSASSHGNMKAYPIIAHISDVHGDYKRFENSIEISNLLRADAIVMSGDIVANNPSNGAKWMHGLLSKSNAKPILCVGNHEVTQSGITDAQVYSYFMEESATIIGNTSGKTYYYTDIPSANLRIISVDLYQYGATTRSNAHMTSEQLEYICNALIDTPSGYGVVIVAHTPCVDVGSLMDSNYPTFFQQLRKYGFTHYDIDGAPIYDIVDAFIGRTTISRTYTQTGSPSSISVSADFSGVDSSVEFIAHMTGHIHEDSVCYLPTTHKQLMLNIECGVCFFGGSSYPYLADDCDTTRLPKGKTQNAINMYIVDRAAKRIKIVRIGASKTYDRKKREYMAIPYAD